MLFSFSFILNHFMGLAFKAMQKFQNTQIATSPNLLQQT